MSVPPQTGDGCPLCGSPLRPEQEWCLRCGAAARTRLASTPNWRAPLIGLGLAIVLALGALTASLVKLAGGPTTTPPSTITRTVSGPGTATTPPTATTATTPTTSTTAPGGILPGATTPGATTPGATTPGTTTRTPGATTPPSALNPGGATAPGTLNPNGATTPRTPTAP